MNKTYPNKIRFLLNKIFLGYIFILIFSFLFRASMPGELLVSFLPIWLILGVFLSFLILILNLFWKKSNLENPIEPVKSKFWLFFKSILVITFLLVYTSFSIQVYDVFSVQKFENISSKSLKAGTKTLKVVFLNIYYRNENYPAVNQTLERLKPDILAFAEFRGIHYENIPYLKKYTSQFPEKFSQELQLGSDLAVFSNYPLYNTEYIKLVNNRSLYTETVLNNQKIGFLINHLATPLTLINFGDRNEDLKKIKQIGDDNQLSKFLILGDFNVTPWSAYYPKFRELKNPFWGRGYYTTWRFGVELLAIDSAFITPETNVRSLGMETQQGSDHKILWLEVD